MRKGVLLLAGLLLCGPVFADDQLAADDQKCLEAWQAENFFQVGMHCNSAAKRGGPISQYVMGMTKRNTKKPGARGNKKAFELFELSAGQGYGPAMTALGRMYKFGLAVDKDACTAENYFRRGAENGDYPANFLLAASLFLGDCAGEQNLAGSLPYYRACATADVMSRQMVGTLTAYVDQDYVEARGWMKALEDRGEATDQLVTIRQQIENLMTPEDLEASLERAEAIVASIEANEIDCTPR